MLLTVNLPRNIDIPESQSRGMYIVQRMPNQMYNFLRSVRCHPMITTIGLESHRGGRKKSAKKKKQDDCPSGEEQEVELQACAKLADGDHTLRRKTLAGQCHVHMAVHYLEPQNVKLPKHDIRGACELTMYPDCKLTKAQ